MNLTLILIQMFVLVYSHYLARNDKKPSVKNRSLREKHFGYTIYKQINATICKVNAHTKTRIQII